MRSRIDIKVRLAAHILAVAIIIFIWMSVVPQQTFDSSRFAEGEATPVSTATDTQEWSQPAPVVDAVPLPDETAVVETPLVVEEQIAEPVVEEPEVTPTETPEETTVVIEPGPQPEPEQEPEPIATPVTEEPVADTVPEPATPTEEPIADVVPVPAEAAEEATLATPPEEESPPAVPSLEPEEFFVEETETIIPDKPAPAEEPEPAVQPDLLTPQPDESGALAVADTQLPEAASLPLPEIDGLEFYRDGLYWLVIATADDERLGLLPNGTQLLYLYGSKESLPNAALLNTQLFLATADTLSEDSAEQFLRVVDSLRSRPAGLAAAVVLSDNNTSAYYKGVYLLAVQGIDFDAMLTAIEPELQLSGDVRDEIIHRLRRLDLMPLKQAVQ